MCAEPTQAITAPEKFAVQPEKMGPTEYNFEHFRRDHLLEDVRRTMEEAGIRPGEPAPDFELPRVGGGSVRLGDLRGQPVLLRFGSFT